jgi:hypothetical protein
MDLDSVFKMSLFSSNITSYPQTSGQICGSDTLLYGLRASEIKYAFILMDDT